MTAGKKTGRGRRVLLESERRRRASPAGRHREIHGGDVGSRGGCGMSPVGKGKERGAQFPCQAPLYRLGRATVFRIDDSLG
jgi:hypothetical protein